MNEDRFAALLEDTAAQVAKGHWTVMGIIGGKETNFHYTAGAYCHKLPELIVFGLPYATAGFLNELGERLKAERPPLEDGLLIEGILRGEAVKLRLLGRLGGFVDESEHDHFGYLIRFAGRRSDDWREIEVVQMLWPDDAGRFPDEAACEVADCQPLLRGARAN